MVKVDEGKTEKHYQIIKKPGVNNSDNDDVKMKPKLMNVVECHKTGGENRIVCVNNAYM